MHWGSLNWLQVGLRVHEGQKFRTAALAFQCSAEIHAVICVSEIIRATTRGSTNGHVSLEVKMMMPKWHAEFGLHSTSFGSLRYMVVAFNEY